MSIEGLGARAFLISCLFAALASCHPRRICKPSVQSGGIALTEEEASSRRSAETEPRTSVAGAKSTPNLFASLLGKSESEVNEKVRTGVNRFFGIGGGEPNIPTPKTGYRCYYELPQDPSMAFIWAADSNDVRSEGMSYGMMLAVQMDLRQEFDKLWRFSKEYMQYPSTTAIAPWKHYFRWQGRVDTANPKAWRVTFSGTTAPAPDGDEYFAAALYLAHERWGSAGSIDYRREADNIAIAMLHNVPSDSRFPIISKAHQMIVFVPYGESNEFTDPSYHLPAYYELFALYGPPADSARWRSLAAVSRDFLVKSAHSATGLHPDYATFAGAPTSGHGEGHEKFKYDAWRVVMNMALDHVLFSTDPKLKAQVEKYHAFFADHLTTNNVANSLFAVDGSQPSGGGSTALTATLAVGSFASEHPKRENYVANLWGVAQQEGLYRYYQQSVYLLGLLKVAGRFNYSW